MLAQNVVIAAWLLTCSLGSIFSARAAEFYVAPAGNPKGTGSKNSPWDLETALKQPPVVRPGDTIWLRGGDYRPSSSSSPGFKSYLGGGSNAPIVVRQCPGERATLREVTKFTGSDDDRLTILYVFGSNTWFWGFDVASSSTTRVIRVAGSDPTPSQLPLPAAINVAGTDIKLINLIVHDTRGGLGLWAAATNCEAYGCIIYNNGWTAPDRGHGHGIYTQNLNGTKHLSDNIIFNHLGLGIHGYTVNSFLQNYLIERNVIFNNAHFAAYPDVDTGEQMLFGGGTRIKNLRILNNYFYSPLDLHGPTLRPDYGTAANDNVMMVGNYIAGGSGGGNYLVSARSYNSVVFTQNTLYSTNGCLLRLLSAPGYAVDNNSYYGNANKNFRNGNVQYNLAGWQSTTGFDSHSRYVEDTAPPNQVFVNRNAFEPRRANIVAYNWSKDNNVFVDVSSVLNKGDMYEVRNAQDYFAPPVLTGKFIGSPLCLPMTNLTVAVPNGWPNKDIVPRTGTQFNVFVLTGSK